MRKIEFRATYSGDNPTIIFSQVYIDGQVYFENKEHEIIYAFEIPFMDDDWLLEQYTGLKDKNGVKIFEGDILNVEYNYIGEQVAEFSNGKFNISSYKLDSCSVVGNIHETEDK